MSNKKKAKRNKGKRRLLIAFILIILFTAFGYYIYGGLPSLEQLENPKPQLASTVYTIDGEQLGKYFIENRIEKHFSEFPPFLIKALISTEDRKFYSHWGVDILRFGKAMVKNILTFSREGASTITQQLAKNLYKLKSHKENIAQTIVRKIREWITAIQIEKTYTKNEILELYLNVSYFGRGAYGVESASKIYFNKSVNELTLPEAALFVALLKSSSYYNPVRHPVDALLRRNLVMRSMVVMQELSEADYRKFKKEPIILSEHQIKGSKSIAPYFMEYVRKKLSALSSKYNYDLYRDGLNIYTTIDSRMQKIANEVVAEHITNFQKMFNSRWDWEDNKDLLATILDEDIRYSKEYKEAETKEEKARIYNSLKYDNNFIENVKKDATKIQVGFVVIDPFNGQIKAMVGGENQIFGRGLNHVTEIRRQPGSAMKPFIYTVAISNGYYPTFTMLNQKFDYHGWSPSNFSENEYGGYTTLRSALAHSFNVIAGRMTTSNIAPPNQVVKFAHKMGIKSRLAAVPSIALGTSEVTPLEMTSAFGTIINKGVHVSPTSVTKIEDRNNILIDKFIPIYTEAISVQTASIMANMLQSVVTSGTGRGVRRYFSYPAAGKTGTTQNFADAWYVGFTPDLAAGVWVGFDDHRIKFTNTYGQGAVAAMPIWSKFMGKVYKELNIPIKYFHVAPGVVRATFCKTTMDLGDPKIATSKCPETVSDIIISKDMPGKCETHTEDDKIKKEKDKNSSDW